MQKLTLVLILISVLLVSSCASNTINESHKTPTVTTTPENTLTITPTIDAELPAYTSTTLEIIRNGEKYSVLLGYDIGEAFFYATPRPDVDMSNWYGDTRNVRSANIERYGDFDHDGENEYFVSAYGRGAIGYVLILAIDYDQLKDEYKVFDEIGFRASCFEQWDDVEKDGIPEIIAKDEDFHYESGGGGADSVFSPIKILRYDGEKFVGVTKEYPDLIEQNANHWLEAIENDAWGQGQFKSIYASYLADMYLLGKKDEGIEVFSELCAKRLIPYIKSNNSESTWSCDEYLISVKDALSKSGYD